MSDKPVFVFVPGAWHGPEVWDKVTSLLDQQGYESTSITHRTTSGSNTTTFGDDVQAAKDAIQAQTSQGRHVIVVVHSYGGVVGQSALKGLTRPKDTTTDTKTSYVIGLIVIASGFAQEGMAFLDGTGGRPPPTWRLDPSGFSEITVSARELFYHDLPVAEGDEWVAKLRKQCSKAFTEGRDVMYGGWRDVPVWMLQTTEDKALPVEMQKLFVDMVQDKANVTVREIDSSHSPMLSRAKEVVDVILEAAKALVQ